MTYGQSSDPMVSNCIINAGPDARYLKDFRIQLAKAPEAGEMRYKTQMSLWKNTSVLSSIFLPLRAASTLPISSSMQDIIAA